MRRSSMGASHKSSSSEYKYSHGAGTASSKRRCLHCTTAITPEDGLDGQKHSGRPRSTGAAPVQFPQQPLAAQPKTFIAFISLNFHRSSSAEYRHSQGAGTVSSCSRFLQHARRQLQILSSIPQIHRHLYRAPAGLIGAKTPANDSTLSTKCCQNAPEALGKVAHNQQPDGRHHVERRPQRHCYCRRGAR